MDDIRIVALVSRRQSGETTLAGLCALTTRDVADISKVFKTDALSRLLDHAPDASSQLVNLSALATPISVDSKTVDRWLTILEQACVVRRIRSWHRNDLKRLVNAPKLHFLDTRLLAAPRRVSLAVFLQDRSSLGTSLEGVVYSELPKQAEVSSGDVLISHCRDKDQVEVDFVLEKSGCVVGIEVKASTGVKPEDFHGLKRLQEATGKAFACGIVLHDGDRIQRVGPRLFAMPVSQL